MREPTGMTHVRAKVTHTTIHAQLVCAHFEADIPIPKLPGIRGLVVLRTIFVTEVPLSLPHISQAITLPSM